MKKGFEIVAVNNKCRRKIDKIKEFKKQGFILLELVVERWLETRVFGEQKLERNRWKERL